MTEADDLDLGEYEEAQATPAAEASPDITAIFSEAKIAAIQPKPTLKEMIREAAIAASEIEGRQQRALLAGFADKPDPRAMRSAAILVAAVNFLSLIDANRAAVKRALRGSA